MGAKNYSDSVKLGDIQLKNRVVVSAMTRCRANPLDGIPTELHVEYYTQKAGAGLILTQCVAVSQRGHAFPGAANLYNKQQAQGWKKVVESVHKKNGKIFVQVFHAGRATDPSINGGLQSWAPSAIAQRNKISRTQKDYSVPKAITLEEINIVKSQFLNTFKLAKEVGFDGIQIHGANGYIIDQFIKSGSNKRTDIYGGSIENRARLALQLVDLATTVYNKETVGIKFSPTGRYGDMFDQNPVEIYTYILKELDKKKIGFVEIVRSQGEHPSPQFGYKLPKEQIEDTIKIFRPFFSGILIGNQAYNQQTALYDIQNKDVDMVSFAKLYITNPDLAERLINKYPLNKNTDYTTYFAGGVKGYTDFPFYKAE